MSELLGNPFARAAAGLDDSHPPTRLKTLMRRIAMLALRGVVALLFVAIATVPFAILIGLFTDATNGNWWALACAVITVALTVVMGAGRARAASSPASAPPPT